MLDGGHGRHRSKLRGHFDCMCNRSTDIIPSGIAQLREDLLLFIQMHMLNIRTDGLLNVTDRDRRYRITREQEFNLRHLIQYLD